jgi:hypothetical protein
MKIPGTPVSMRFSLKDRKFTFVFQNDPEINLPAEIFVPPIHYPGGYAVELTAGRFEKDERKCTLRVYPDGGAATCRVVICPG